MAAVIKALFKSNGEESEVVALSYSFDQNVDNIGQPAGEVRGGIINVSLGSLGSEKRFGWAVTSDLKYDGEIEFIDANGKTLKTLKFKEAYCVGYTEDYEAFSGGRDAGNVTVKDGAKEHLTLSCKEISVAGEMHANTWLDA